MSVSIPTKFIQSPDALAELEFGKDVEVKCSVRSYPQLELKLVSIVEKQVTIGIGENKGVDITEKRLSETE